MKNIDGVYRVDMLGPYGWENFSTAFIEDGEFHSASAEHFTAGNYVVDEHGFEMQGNLTQYVDQRPLFGRKNIKDLPITFNGKIQNDMIEGDARLQDRSKHSLRLRLNRMPPIN